MANTVCYMNAYISGKREWMCRMLVGTLCLVILTNLLCNYIYECSHSILDMIDEINHLD